MKYFILFFFLCFQTANSFDFSKYTVIDKETKDFLRAKRQNAHPDFSFQPGVLSVFGNSLTIESDFWSNIPESKIGIVKGTVDSTYADGYKCANYGNTIWDASYCFKTAVTDVRPEAVIIMFGTNEAMGAKTNVGWEIWQQQYGVLVDSLLLVGTIPIISTIPPLFEEWDSTDVPVDTITQGINSALRSLAKSKHVVLVDYNQAMIDYTNGDVFNKKWWGDYYVHPSGDCEPDTSEPTCGYGIRNAVCWQAVNKVYRIIIDDGTPDTGASYTVKNERKIIKPKVANNFSVITNYRANSIELTLNMLLPPKSIRLLAINGKRMEISVSRASASTLIRMDKVVPGIYIVEADIEGETCRSRVLLTPQL